MLYRVTGANVESLLLSRCCALLCLFACASTHIGGPLDAAGMAAIAQRRAAAMLDAPGPCRDWFVDRGLVDPGHAMRRADIRAIKLKGTAIAGTPYEETDLIFVDVAIFAALSRQGATLSLIHELSHTLIRGLKLSKEDAEVVAYQAELACFGARVPLWVLESWNEETNE